MEKIKQVAKNNNFTAVNIGALNNLMAHSLIHPKSGQSLEGKVFLKGITDSTGTEVSFNALQPKTDLPYFHIHHKNEETYIILKGEGFFHVDDQRFEISEGSVIRIAPAGKRSLINTSDEKMIYMVIQSKENSLEEYSADDSERVNVNI